MNGKILFFDEWKNFNASLNEEIESRKLTEKQKEEFYKNGEFDKKYDDFLEGFLGTITGTIANYMSTYHIEKKKENDKNYSHMEQIWGEGFDLYWNIVNKKDTIFKYIFWERLDSLPIPECCFHFIWC